MDNPEKLTIKEKTEKVLIPVETLAQNENIDIIILAGVMALKGWQPGKAVTTMEFQKAVNEFKEGK